MDEDLDGQPASAQSREGITLNAFFAALTVSIVVFVVQIAVFLLLRNKLARIFKPKTYLAPERERFDPPPASPIELLKTLYSFTDREIIKRCGLDAYFFLRYLRALLIIFVPIALVTIPILIPLNYIGGRGNTVLDTGDTNNSTGNDDQASYLTPTPTGLDTLAFGNITGANSQRYWAHLILALLVIVWVCLVIFFELRVYIKIRQDYLTSAEHRLRASATTVLVNNVPAKWLTQEAIRGLFDVFPGGIRNVWLNRDLSSLLEKIELRDAIHKQLEAAETQLVRAAKKRQLKERKKDEKKDRRLSRLNAPTKSELEQRRKREDEAARRMAEAGQGVSSGTDDQVPRNVSEVVDDARAEEQEQRRRSRAMSSSNSSGSQGKGFGLGTLGDGINKFGKGILGGVDKAGQGFRALGQGVENEVGTTHGFIRIGSSGTDAPTTGQPPHASGYDGPATYSSPNDDAHPSTVAASAANQPQMADLAGEDVVGYDARNGSVDDSRSSSPIDPAKFDTVANGNTVRRLDDISQMYDNEKRKWYQFWRPPAGGYVSPVPQKVQYGGDESVPDNRHSEKTSGQKILSFIPFVHSGGAVAPVEYGPASFTGEDYRDDTEGESEAAWRQYIKPKDRPKHRVPRWGFPGWLAWLTFGKKVDTIYWCRTELARLNLEIRTDQQNPERYPLMSSAFIQFNEQISAHLACQSLIHHLPKQMAPRINEISPKDVIWSNMAISWWDEWLRTAAVVALIATMVIFWSFPVAWTAAIANIDSLAELPFLQWIKSNDTVEQVSGAIAGVLPPVLLALLLVIVPIILDLLADFKGAKTGTQKSEFVQRYFFIFLFVQVFLVVSIAAFFAASVDTLWTNFQELGNINYIWEVLAENLPKAANYFFSYMLLQAFSASSGALLQIGTLVVWYVLAKILDDTARSKWSRNVTLNKMGWAHVFPVYTNFACIALIYSVVAPLISVFAIITFGLLWVSQKYCLVYVIRNGHDTGGIMYPTALNQTFTGLYVMELCLAGLFFIVGRDAAGSRGSQTAAATSGNPQAIIMLVAVALTALYQVLLNRSFSPLFRYLPVTVEDEAALRDRAFEQEQLRRFGMLEESEDEDGNDEKPPAHSLDGCFANDDDIELKGLPAAGRGKKSFFKPVKDVRDLAKRGGKGIRNMTWNRVEGRSGVKNAAEYRRRQREKDLEAQRAIGEALYGGIADEIEDLMPEERNALVRDAFKHRALRARVPAVWIPRDDLGVSDDEVRLTMAYTENIHISNEGTALDSKVRVVYGRNPPDFSEVDLIDL
ncbi:DUF221-domain-containing protein [Sodiomyces alkalinus F11]|uniref:DUF221-domain-containing protein n=1 Tax=Sodiomyces alkalinus (strain CBS 110278 / VKM F-3762 / F11) TaxID=1314773 RepID=A0A3N2Q1R3_SODAK|nr:DUF221-domain-containing protein [Sodiomyces alkalinus F11]ROT40687.1 DUF221-domain-containing protein [Sodiomyces alkalinus F11]